MAKDLAALEIEALKLSSEIRANYREMTRGLRDSVQHALELGRLFSQVKESLPHGEFVPHVERVYGYEIRNVQNWMRAHRNIGELPKNETVSFLSQDTKLMDIVHYDKLKRENSDPSKGLRHQDLDRDCDVAIELDNARDESTNSKPSPATNGPPADNGQLFEEVEVDEWEYNAEHHKSLVDAINAFGRFLSEVMETEDSSEYIRHAETRIRADMKQLKNTVWQLMPVGQKRTGKIITRNEEQARKR